MAMHYNLNDIINKLILPDNNSIQSGTKELSEALKSATVISELCEILAQNPSPQVRQYAALILKRRLGRFKHWSKIDANTKIIIKDGILQTLMRETEKSNQNSICQLIAAIAKHELPVEQWPNLVQFMTQLMQSQNSLEKLLGIFVLSVVSEHVPDELTLNLTEFLQIFPTLMSSENYLIQFYTISTLTNFAGVIGQDHMTSYQQLLPAAIEVIKNLIAKDEEKAAEALDLFDVLSECEVALLVPQLKSVIGLCLNISTTTEFSDALRTKAIAFLGYIIRLKKKYMVKHKLSDNIVLALFKILCEESDNDEQFFSTDNSEGDSPIQAAAQAMDSCAIHLPPDKILPIILPLVDQAFSSQDILQVKGAYLSLGMICEGCSDTLRTKHLDQLLQCISRGITSKQQIILNSALFSLGQFVEHLQPDISKYHAELFPVLCAFLKEVCMVVRDGSSDPPASADRIFYALETVCENLEEEIIPHLPTLMECFLSILNNSKNVHLLELSISAIGITASSAKNEMLRYFDKIIAHMRPYLTEEQPDDKMSLQVQSLDTLAGLSRSIGADLFRQYAPDCCALAMDLLDKNDDPDVKKACYMLFASLSAVMNENEVKVHLPKLMDYIFGSLRSVEGLMTDMRNDVAMPTCIEGLSDEDSEAECDDMGDEDIESKDSEVEDALNGLFAVENSYVQEKEESCLALKDLAQNCGEYFLVYLEQAQTEVLKLLNYPQEDVRIASISTIVQFAICAFKSPNPFGQKAFETMIQTIVPKLTEIVNTDMEYGVVQCALEGFTDVLRECGPAVVQAGQAEKIIECAMVVMAHKTACQTAADDDMQDTMSEEGESEQDELLIEHAGEIVPCFGNAIGPAKFAAHFPKLLPVFLNKMKKSSSVAERSFAVGTLAETVEALGHCTSQFLDQLMPIFLQAAQDKDSEVRSNALFGIGVLGQYGGDAIFEHYHVLLNALSNALRKEDFPRAVDNISGAVARLIMTNISRVPMEQVFPVFLRYLPLKEDFEENKTVFSCFLTLFEQNNKEVFQHLEAIIKLCIEVFNSKSADEETNLCIHKILLELKRSHSDKLEILAQNLVEEQKVKLQNIFTI